MKQKQTDLPSCEIKIDKEGRWFHKGAEMIRRDFIQLFYQNMELNSSSQYIINWMGQSCYVDVEDTAFVVKSVICKNTGTDLGTRFIVVLNDYTNEDLSPDTLYVGSSNILYCRVKERSFPARFNRASYYQIAQYFEEEKGIYYLKIDGIRHIISQGTDS